MVRVRVQKKLHMVAQQENNKIKKKSTATERIRRVGTATSGGCPVLSTGKEDHWCRIRDEADLISNAAILTYNIETFLNVNYILR